MQYFIHKNFYIAGSAIVCGFIISLFVPIFFNVMLIAIVALVFVTLADFSVIKKLGKNVSISRNVDIILSLGEFQPVNYTVVNQSPRSIECEIIDELPYQLQIREGLWKGYLQGNTEETIKYNIKPNSRGEYHFGYVYLFFQRIKFPLIIGRISNDEIFMSKVYPSVIQMHKVEFLISNKTAHNSGIRKIRSLGDDDEFEHLRSYVPGNNIKHINWKATSRRNELMVNQYQDTRSQNIYMLIDKSRCMEMPFDQMALLDYAINACLVFTKVILKKYDKPGIITFNNKVDHSLAPHSSLAQLSRINEVLYNQNTDFLESNFDVLYMHIRNNINKRSVLFLFTNFENHAELNRNLAYLKLISKSHLLIVVSFINDELQRMIKSEAESVSNAFENVVAETLLVEKEQILRILNQHGIMTILTTPKDLTIDTVNKYLEIKARRLK